MCCVCIRAVELGITAEDLIVAEQGYEVDRSPTTRIIMTADSDTEEARIKVKANCRRYERSIP